LKPVVKHKVVTIAEPLVYPEVVTELKPEPFKPVPTPVAEVAPPKKPPIKPPPFPPDIDIKEKKAKLPEGSIAWLMGLFWKHIAPPWTQKKPFTLPKGIAPLGAVRTHLRTPAETIQVIGSSKGVPETISIDLGITDAYISNYGTKIDFTGEGEHTDAGISLDSPTVGMSIPATMRARVKTKPKRKKQKLSRYEYATTLKGFRP